MKLKSFHVRLFRNIIDSGEIPVDSVTALVGKNESGKSAILQALHHLNPAKPSFALDLLDEYPRWLKKEHEITGEINSAVPVTATFELSHDEVAELEAGFGAGVLSDRHVTVSRSYAKPKTLTIEAHIEQAAFVAPFIAGLSERLGKAIGSPTTTTEVSTALDKVAAGTNTDGEPTAVAKDAAAAKETLSEKLGGAANLTTAVQAFVRERIPRTFYFSSYSSLRGRYNLDEVFSALNDPDAEEELAAAADFLRLARAVPETLQDWDFEKSNAELEAASSLLTRRVKEHWKQNDHLKLAVRIEDQVETDPRTAAPVIKRYLQFRVEDSRHDFSSRLDRRSTGFQWFVSFLASFLEFEKDKNLILLLDEPGLSLHARAQIDLLNTIESRLATDRQVLYSTHSPFLVQTPRLNQVRIVEDQGPDLGSAVIPDAGVVKDPDTLFPLQAALGYDIAHNLFIGNRNILIEGVSDFIYLSTISDHLSSLGRASIPESARLLPAGGATNIPTFLALLGGQLDVVVLLDGSSDKQKIENTIKRGRLDAARVISLDNYATPPTPDIEDLFEPGEYLAFYNEAYGVSLKLSDLSGKDRIVARITRKIGKEFNHGHVAAVFLRNLDRSIQGLSVATLERFEQVIEALVRALPAE
ncbi:AAA family ATPase [Microbacterium schleiferi]|uniref:AAA family ATPase n=1 Tax=Microbacterium schleiferi TaxID=69362 RepID=A0A7S8RGJ6_9MICO|nr:AAA family ATPase [Microbacterium schleiferi]QPE03351.1 AAA family ATPase [Microbacterium schleiferi]